MFLQASDFTDAEPVPVPQAGPQTGAAGVVSHARPRPRPLQTTGSLRDTVKMALPKMEDDDDEPSDGDSEAEIQSASVGSAGAFASHGYTSSHPGTPSAVHMLSDSLASSAPGSPLVSNSPQARMERLKQQQKQLTEKRKQVRMVQGVIRADSPMRPSSPSTPSTPLTPNPMERSNTPPTVLSSRANTVQTSAGASPYTFGMDRSRPVSAESDPSVDDLLRKREMEKTSKTMSTVERELMAQGIAPVFDPVRPIYQDAKIDYSDIRSFLTSPGPINRTVECTITRNNSGLSNRMYPCYVLESDRFLLNAKKRSGNKTSNYLISMEKDEFDKNSAGYLGKLRSNFVGTEFVVFDKGLNPKEVALDASAVSQLTVRQELGLVVYEPNILGTKGPRKMMVHVPSVSRDGNNIRSVFRPSNVDSVALKEALVDGDKKRSVFTLTNKTPKWHEQVGAYVLNFNGRVTQASVKNFQLVFEDEQEDVILQFGRVGKNKFTMDFKWPLSPLQAFAICLSSFDHKLACE